MKSQTVDEYVNALTPERKAVIEKIRKTLKENLPQGFEEQFSYGMLGFVVPKNDYEPGYHVNPKLPLPFINLASQKNFIALYHMGLYANEEVLDWFKAEYAKRVSTKLDMGKSCIRFKKMDQIPYELIAQLAQKMTVNQWIKIYEENIRKK